MGPQDTVFRPSLSVFAWDVSRASPLPGSSDESWFHCREFGENLEIVVLGSVLKKNEKKISETL